MLVEFLWVWVFTLKTTEIMATVTVKAHKRNGKMVRAHKRVVKGSNSGDKNSLIKH